MFCKRCRGVVRDFLCPFSLAGTPAASCCRKEFTSPLSTARFPRPCNRCQKLHSFFTPKLRQRERNKLCPILLEEALKKEYSTHRCQDKLCPCVERTWFVDGRE